MSQRADRVSRPRPRRWRPTRRSFEKSVVRQAEVGSRSDARNCSIRRHPYSHRCRCPHHDWRQCRDRCHRRRTTELSQPPATSVAASTIRTTNAIFKVFIAGAFSDSGLHYPGQDPSTQIRASAPKVSQHAEKSPRHTPPHGHVEQPEAGLYSRQLPPSQILSRPQSSPQPPQLRGSVSLSTQAPLHSSSVPHPTSVQLRIRQTIPRPHVVPRVPQLFGSVFRSTQLPSTSTSPGRHMQVPPEQYSSLLHSTPTPPQCLGSAWVSRQLPRSGTSPGGHVHAPDMQAPPPGSHMLPQRPQWSTLALTSTQPTPGQMTSPGAQVQMPAVHVPPAPHELPQVPQFSGSESSPVVQPPPQSVVAVGRRRRTSAHAGDARGARIAVATAAAAVGDIGREVRTSTCTCNQSWPACTDAIRASASRSTISPA